MAGESTDVFASVGGVTLRHELPRFEYGSTLHPSDPLPRIIFLKFLPSTQRPWVATFHPMKNEGPAGRMCSFSGSRV